MSTEIRHLADRYAITVFWSGEDGAYIAVCPDFKGLSALGGSPAEAVNEARIVLEGFVESHLEHGDPLPEPRAAAA